MTAEVGTLRVAIILLLFLVLIAWAGLVLCGRSRWRAGTLALRERLESARMPIQPRVFDRRELQRLPEPVQRYFRTALNEGQPMVSAVRVEHTGTFNMSDTSEQWKLFTSDQRVIARLPGFDWDARIAMAPFLPVYVHDAYVAGEGMLYAKVIGLFSVADLRGTPEAARGELMRFLAEAAWYPTALLPSQGVIWTAADRASAHATLHDGVTTVTLLFRFNEAGLIESVFAADRGRVVKGAVIPTAWEGRFRNYEKRHGMLVPVDGEVAWVLPDGAKPYWRGHITRIEYEFAR